MRSWRRSSRRIPTWQKSIRSRESRTALEVFRVAEGSGEYFDLSVTPIYRDTFTLGREQKKEDRDHGNPDIKQRKEE